MAENDWIEWKGGQCPVEPEALVELRLRKESVWETGDYADGRRAGQFDWAHLDACGDIIAYRVVAS